MAFSLSNNLSGVCSPPFDSTPFASSLNSSEFEQLGEVDDLSMCHVRWRGFQGNVMLALNELQSVEEFVDVTIYGEGGISLHAHKLILATGSPYFRRIFAEHSCSHPVLIMSEVAEDILKAVMNYIYHGVVSLPHSRLADFLTTARSLQIKGIPVDENSKIFGQNTSKHQQGLTQLPLSEGNFDHVGLAMLAAAASHTAIKDLSTEQRMSDTHCYQAINLSTTEEDMKSDQIGKFDYAPLDMSLASRWSQFLQRSLSASNEDFLPSSSLGVSDVQESVKPQIVVSPLPSVSTTIMPESTAIISLYEYPRCKENWPELSSLSCLNASSTHEQCDALLSPSWKSRQPRLCHHCQRMFSNKFNLKQHILNMHTIGHEIQCEICTKKVKNKWYLRRHHVTYHGAPLKK